VDVLQDALHRLGDGRTYTRGCSADELLAIGIAERTAARVALHYGTGRSNGRRCVLGSPPGNQHTLGLRMISDVLRHHGWDTLFLGAGAPRAAFADLVRRKEPDLVLVSCPTANLAEEARGLLEELRRMRRVSDRPFLIGVGGSYVNACPRYASEVGADFTAPDARALSHAVTHLFGA
jgi:methanogenic corrinoid protein MtbC1